jgi:hypothetical protein
MALKKYPPAPPRRGAALGLADFDEQLWPVNLLLFVFAACVAALIIAKSDFTAPQLLANGWCHLGILAAIVGSLAWGVARLDRRVQRRMQLGVFLSLLVHLWLCLLSCNIYLSAIARRERDAPEAFEEPASVTLPDYHWQDQATDDASDPTLARPVETAVPETEQEVERTQPAEEPQPRPIEPEPDMRPTPPTTAAIERTEMTAPRRAADLSGERLSRQELRLADTREQAALPEVTEAHQKTMESPVRVERSQARVEPNRPATETVLPTSQPATRLPARRQREEAAPENTAMILPRAQTNAATRDPTRPTPERVTDAPSVTQLQAANREVERAETAVRMARRVRPVRESPSVSVDVAARRSERTNSTAQPRIVSRADSQLAKATSHADAAQPTAVASPISAAARPASELRETQIEQVGRASAQLPTAAMVGTPTESTASPTAGTLTSNVELAARSASNEPSLSSATHTAVPRRVAVAASGEAAVAEPSAPATAAASDLRSFEPTTTAISKASGGAPGLTRQQNFDTEMPGVSSSAVAQSAARRPESVQTMAPGVAAAPSMPAKIAKARAAADAPAASMPAEEVTVADAPGSVRPAEAEASSSAAAERLAAAAPRANRTAAVGAGAIDQGAPQINSAIGERRTSGGGEPLLARSETTSKVAKATQLADAGGAGTQIAASAVGAEGGAGPAAGPAPAVDAVGRSATGSFPTPPVMTAGSAAGGPGKPTLAASIEARRDEGAPEIASVQSSASPAGRPRGAAAAVDANVDFDGSPQLASASTSESGDAEPSSASDVVRQSPAALPGGRAPSEVGDAAFATAVPTTGGPAVPHRSDDAPAITASGGDNLVRGQVMTAGVATDVADLDDVGGAAAPAAEGERLAMADLGQERQAAALPVLVRAPAASGGLDAEPCFDVGVPDRRARPESDVAHLESGRLILERSGATRAAEVRVQDVAVPGYRQRDRQMREELVRQRGGSEGSEKAVEMGLDFLARHQNVDGSWSLQNFSQGRPGYENAGDGQMVSDTAATGLSMLAFLGAGYTHTDGKYRLAVARGLNYLLGNQQPDGDLFLPQEAKSNLNVWLYSHGIAAIALCEAYGMTRDPELRQPAQRALDFIVAAQHPTDGGWRYAPRQGSDTSVSGWQLMALKSGELSGLRVPAAAYAKVGHWLDGAHARGDEAKYVYRPKSNKAHQKSASRVMTAEALLMRQYLGWKRDHRLMTAGADYLMEQLPEWSIKPDWQRDSYYWYYGTQVMFQMGGIHWDAWNERLRPLLVEQQVQTGPLAGSWQPMGDVPDRWGREGGRIYVTAMHLLMLEVYYRHLPLYRTLED